MFQLLEIGIDALDRSVAECIVSVWNDGDATKVPEVISANRELCSSEKDPLILIAKTEDGQVVGFRIGHALQGEEGVFYDQNGGVHPGFRRRGIARDLLREQHQIVQNRGYRIIRTGVALSLKPMIILNLQDGFEITDLVWNEEFKVKVLLLEKRLR